MAKKKPELTSGILNAIRGEVKEPQLSEVAAHFFELAGGPRAVAKMLFDAYMSPNCSPMMRHRILQVALFTVKWANQQSGPREDLGLVSKEDLEREAAELFDKVKGGSK